MSVSILNKFRENFEKNGDFIDSDFIASISTKDLEKVNCSSFNDEDGGIVLAIVDELKERLSD